MALSSLGRLVCHYFSFAVPTLFQSEGSADGCLCRKGGNSSARRCDIRQLFQLTSIFLLSVQKFKIVFIRLFSLSFQKWLLGFLMNEKYTNFTYACNKQWPKMAPAFFGIKNKNMPPKDPLTAYCGPITCFNTDCTPDIFLPPPPGKWVVPHLPTRKSRVHWKLYNRVMLESGAITRIEPISSQHCKLNDYSSLYRYVKHSDIFQLSLCTYINVTIYKSNIQWYCTI